MMKYLTPNTYNLSPKSKGLALSLSKGFTLIELLIVMVILGILTTIVASSFRSSQEKAHDSRRKNDLESLAKALEVYYNDHSRYPGSNNGNLSVTNCGTSGDNACNFGGEFIDDNGSIYMSKVPEETSSARSYYYFSDGQNQSFALFARLENELDASIPRNEDEENQYFSGTDCGAGYPGCNYAVHSTNLKPETQFPLVDE